MFDRPRQTTLALMVAALLISACSGSASVAQESGPDAEPAVQATVQPQPTEALPVEPTPTEILAAEPTEVPTQVPDPTPEPTVETTVTAVPTEQAVITPVQLPAFVEPPTELSDLIGTIYEDALPQLDFQESNQIGGASLLNIAADDSDWFSLEWRVEGDRVPMGLSSFVERTQDGSVVWQLESTWLLQMEPESVLTFDTNVCKAELTQEEVDTGRFMAVVNQEQDKALGAWIMTIEGPVPFEQPLDTLSCERFIP